MLYNFNNFILQAFNDNTFVFQPQAATHAAIRKHENLVGMPYWLRKFNQITVTIT